MSTKCLVSLDDCYKYGVNEGMPPGISGTFLQVLLNPPCIHACLCKPLGLQVNTSLFLIICEQNDMKWKMVKMMMLHIYIQPQYRNCWCHLLLKTQNWKTGLGADFYTVRLCSVIYLNKRFKIYPHRSIK